MQYRPCQILLFVFCLILVSPQPAKASDAKSCVLEIGEAIEQADTDRFTQLVDVDGVLGHVLDAFLQWAKKPDIAKEMPPMLAIALMQAEQNASAGKMIRSLLLTESRAFLLDGIASGAFAGKKKPHTAQGILAPLFANASLGRKEITHVGEAEDLEGGWLVPFSVRDWDNGQVYPINGFVERVQGECQLTNILNVQELFERIEEEARSLEE